MGRVRFVRGFIFRIYFRLFRKWFTAHLRNLVSVNYRARVYQRLRRAPNSTPPGRPRAAPNDPYYFIIFRRPCFAPPSIPRNPLPSSRHPSSCLFNVQKFVVRPTTHNHHHQQPPHPTTHPPVDGRGDSARQPFCVTITLERFCARSDQIPETARTWNTKQYRRFLSVRWKRRSKV